MMQPADETLREGLADLYVLGDLDLICRVNGKGSGRNFRHPLDDRADVQTRGGHEGRGA